MSWTVPLTTFTTTGSHATLFTVACTLYAPGFSSKFHAGPGETVP
ncbi:MAG TPA: hypothetical protein VIJ31_15045 [Acidothermaceae bacterium]